MEDPERSSEDNSSATDAPDNDPEILESTTIGTAAHEVNSTMIGTNSGGETEGEDNYITDTDSGSDSEDNQNGEGDHSSTSGVASKEGSHFGGWMGAITKKTLQTISSKGSGILAAPGKKYREYQESHEERRRRALELETKLEELRMECSDVAVHTQTLALRGGAENRLIGTEQDLDLIRIHWYRCRPVIDEGRVSYSDITELENVSGGFYTPSADDIGCRIRAKVQLTERATFGIAGTAPTFEAGLSVDCPLVADPSVKSVADKYIRDGKADFYGIRLANDPLSTASIHLELVHVTASDDDEANGIIDAAGIGKEDDEVEKAGNQYWLKLVVFKHELVDSGHSDDETSVAEHELKSSEDKDNGGADDVTQQESLTENNNKDNNHATEQSDESNHKVETKQVLQLEGRFPLDRLRVCLRASDPHRFSIHVGDQPSNLLERGPDRYRLQLSAESHIQRDVIALTLRGLRDRVHFLCPRDGFPPNLPYQYDYPPKRPRSGSMPTPSTSPKRKDDSVQEGIQDNNVKSDGISPAAAGEDHIRKLEHKRSRGWSMSLGSFSNRNSDDKQTNCSCNRHGVPVISLMNKCEEDCHSVQSITSAETDDSTLLEQHQVMCACDNMYPTVYIQLEYLPVIFDEVEVANALRKSQSSSAIQKVTSLFSSALGKRGSDRSKPQSKTSAPQSTPANIVQSQVGSNDTNSLPLPLFKGPVQDSVNRIPIDLLSAAGCSVERKKVIVRLEEGEGLGITFATRHILRESSMDYSVVYVSAFCPIQVGDSQEPGKVQKTGLVRVGDVLVAVGGDNIYKFNGDSTTNTASDVSDETTLVSLSRVAELVKKWRSIGKGNESGHESCNLELTFAPPVWTPTEVIGNGTQSVTSSPKFWPFRQSNSTSNHSTTSSPSSQSDLMKSDVVSGEQGRHSATSPITNSRKQNNGTEGVVTTSSKANVEAQSQLKRELRKKEQNVKRLCMQLEAQKKQVLEAETERNLMFSERDGLRQRCRELEAQYNLAKKELKTVKDERKLLEEQVHSLDAKLLERETQIKQVAGESENWTERLQAKEEALRKIDAEFRASKVSKDNLQSVLDGSREERDKLEKQVKDLTFKLSELENVNKRISQELIEAHSEADRLTAELREQQDRASFAEERREQETSKAQKQEAEYRRSLAVEKTRSQALEDSATAANERADEEAKARLLAEKKARDALEREAEAVRLKQESDAAVVEAQNALQKRIEDDIASRDRDEEVQEARRDAKATKEENIKVKAENDSLIGQNRSLRAKVQSMQTDVAKMAQLDALKEELEELVVKYHMEKAARQELEDDLLAYKKALREASATDQGKSPKIFGHLVRQLKKEDEAAAVKR